eukprot:TRINITY_DN65856_c1_g1_i1.p1 TRINITY_DN65856_c1_g1~~TRINITY_DN65856_c1_g1_i1.p1  ORF type:complete len:535 (+),score=82.87 TRINITY_DN65856_c1_g1_i1:61-1665(+)
MGHGASSQQGGGGGSRPSSAATTKSPQQREMEQHITKNMKEILKEAGLSKFTVDAMISKLESQMGVPLRDYSDFIETNLSTFQSEKAIHHRLQEQIAFIVRQAKFTKLTRRECIKKLATHFNAELTEYEDWIAKTLEEEKDKYTMEEGKRVGQYLSGETLGKGHYGLVKKALVAETGQRFAIKLISTEHLTTEYTKQQLEREIGIMKTLQHENVLNLKEVIYSPQFVYLVLELVEGGELFDSAPTNKRQFPEDKSRKYFQQLILGLYYCHKRGVAHRDLKPANLLVTTDDVIKVSDFGLSAFQKATDSGNVHESMQLKTCCGSPKYIAPEVVADQGYNGFMADVWSCGVILYLMLTGRAPFEHRTVTGLLKKVMSGKYTMPPEIPPPAQDLISKMLVVYPEQRIKIAQIIEHPWFQVGFNNTKAEAIRLMPGCGDKPGTGNPQTPSVPQPNQGPDDQYADAVYDTNHVAPGTFIPSGSLATNKQDGRSAIPDGVRALGGGRAPPNKAASPPAKPTQAGAAPNLQALVNLTDVKH